MGEKCWNCEVGFEKASRKVLYELANMVLRQIGEASESSYAGWFTKI